MERSVKEKGTFSTLIRSQWLPLSVMVLYAWAWSVDADRTFTALRTGLGIFVSVALLILAVIGFVGVIQVWISRDLVARLLGKEAGGKALLIAAFTGTILIGPPYIIFPLLVAVQRQGARWAVVTTVLTTYAVKLQMIPLEVGFLGWKFSLLRALFTLAIAVPIGLLVERVMEFGKEKAP